MHSGYLTQRPWRTKENTLGLKSRAWIFHLPNGAKNCPFFFFSTFSFDPRLWSTLYRSTICCFTRGMVKRRAKDHRSFFKREIVEVRARGNDRSLPVWLFIMHTTDLPRIQGCTFSSFDYIRCNTEGGFILRWNRRGFRLVSLFIVVSAYRVATERPKGLKK